MKLLHYHQLHYQESRLTSIGLILTVLWYVLLYLSTISFKTSKQTFLP